ncbi:MAG TPA: UPF0179 family protein [Thermoplasmata archaeon]|nr:UPF0179 family protein [Thermoplasmata archaeon]
MAEITLISAAQAKPGFEFIYWGAAPICRTCPYRHACLTLEVGRRYKVSKVRPVAHPCALQEVEARVVEVTPVPRTLVVAAQSAVSGSAIETGRFACSRLDCANWQVCAGPTLPPRQRYTISRAESELAECRIGRSLRRVEAV